MRSGHSHAAGIGDHAAHARPELIPYLTIAAFAGLRSAEIQRLDWSDIALEDGHITVAASKAKTASRRSVPIQSNLKAWLMPYFTKSGPVVQFKNLPKQLGWLAKDAGIKWKKNALRHSFCSYRLAIVQDSAKVAYEAGNSSDIIFRHYHQLVRPAAAKSWFAIEGVSGFPPAQEKTAAGDVDERA
jgi:integrase